MQQSFADTRAAERYVGLVFDVPRGNGCGREMADDRFDHEDDTFTEIRLLASRPGRHMKLRPAGRFLAHGEYDVEARFVRVLDLPVQRIEIAPARLGFDAVPVNA